MWELCKCKVNIEKALCRLLCREVGFNSWSLGQNLKNCLINKILGVWYTNLISNCTVIRKEGKEFIKLYGFCTCTVCT
jgi:hypothetical protein